MKAQASPLGVICCGSRRLRPARPTAERDRQSCGGGARSADLRDRRLDADQDADRPDLGILRVHKLVGTGDRRLHPGSAGHEQIPGSGAWVPAGLVISVACGRVSLS